MNALPNGKCRDPAKPFPGCMGRMINRIESSTGTARTIIHANKEHHDGSPICCRSMSDVVKRPIDPVGINIDDRPIAVDGRKSSSMKVLIAQEMLKETVPKQKQTSIVARLMGLNDTSLVHQQSLPNGKRNLQEGCPRSKSTGSIWGRGQQEDVSFDRNTKRMALVRQNFMEAKRLASDEKLLHSKEFEDALEVLSSNRDLFLKFLEEPNSPFSKSWKAFNPNNEEPVKKPLMVSDFINVKAENPSQPTRIVVLKPTSVKIQPHGDFHRGSEAVGSRDIAKEITRHMEESLSSCLRDESVSSSVLSNGYVGDESSLDKSEIEYIEEDGSSYSRSSSFLTSYSPESPVIREAKLRLSERWASVSKISREQMQVRRRGSSTLGQMLAMPGVRKKEEIHGVFDVSCSTSGGEEEVSSSRSFSRSKSVPASFLAYENIVLSMEASKAKSGKSSFKGKVLSLFSRIKVPCKEEVVPSLLVGSDNRFQSGRAESALKNRYDLLNPVHDSSCEESMIVYSEGQSSKTSTPGSGNGAMRKGDFYSEIAISPEKPRTAKNLSKNQGSLGAPENSSGNQDQPSPTSILDAPFEDDEHRNSPSSSGAVNAGHPQALSRSAPIESVARSLSWNEEEHWREDEDEEEERFLFVQSLLSSAGLCAETVDTVFNRWHSPESPLDPGLLFKFLDARERRSRRRLMFDCVNAALLDIGNASIVNAYPWGKVPGRSQRDAPVCGGPVATEVWGLIRGWFSSEGNWVFPEIGGNGLEGRWAELARMEMDELCREIGGEIMEELVGEVLLDFTRGCM